jgi:hypothetical protein
MIPERWLSLGIGMLEASLLSTWDRGKGGK